MVFFPVCPLAAPGGPCPRRRSPDGGTGRRSAHWYVVGNGNGLGYRRGGRHQPMPTNHGEELSPPDDGDESDERPPGRTTDEIVPVSVPRSIEQEARELADDTGVALEDALADHVNVVPHFCHSAVEDGEPGSVRRVALHTAVTPETAEAIDRLTDDREAWVREAVRGRLAREDSGAAPAADLAGPSGVPESGDVNDT